MVVFLDQKGVRGAFQIPRDDPLSIVDRGLGLQQNEDGTGATEQSPPSPSRIRGSCCRLRIANSQPNQFINSQRINLTRHG